MPPTRDFEFDTFVSHSSKERRFIPLRFDDAAIKGSPPLPGVREKEFALESTSSVVAQQARSKHSTERKRHAQYIWFLQK